MNKNASLMFSAVSFEDRCIIGPERFIQAGGNPSALYIARLPDNSSQMLFNIKLLEKSGLRVFHDVDRMNSRALWEWVWARVSNVSGDVIIDATCLPRELLGMILFALSVRRDRLGRIEVCYTSAPKEVTGGYATQNKDLRDDQRWLSKGVVAIRSILGFPGDFSSEKKRHVIAFAGHEFDRMLQVVEFLEPNIVSVSNEQENTSTVNGAAVISADVATKLRDKIAEPIIRPVKFSANSIDETFKGLGELKLNASLENIALIAMNTKLSFIGAALFALHRRKVRMMYAVPEIYNPLYCVGAGEFKVHDITEKLKTSATTQAR